jgi:hypothetical protein
VAVVLVREKPDAALDVAGTDHLGEPTEVAKLHVEHPVFADLYDEVAP